MSDHANAPHTAATPNGSSDRAKAPWQPPTMEEVDYSATESSPNPGAQYDFALYNPASSTP